MMKNFRTIKVTLMIGLLLSSIIAIFIPVTSAGFITCTSDVKLTYDAEAASTKIIPLKGSITIPLNISVMVKGIFAELAVNRYNSMGVTASVDLSVGETPNWASAFIRPNVIAPELSVGWGPSEIAYLEVSFTEDAPAFHRVEIPVIMHVSIPPTLVFRIPDITREAMISFEPAYLPIIDATPRFTYKEISPGQIATFEIDLKNKGNAETEFLFDIIEIPKGWSASIVSNTKVSPAQDKESEKTVRLFVQPPYGFGYHDDRGDIVISVKGRYFAPSAGTLEAGPYLYRFTVRSKGFDFTPGVGMIPVIVIIALLIGGAIFYYIKKQQKTK